MDGINHNNNKTRNNNGLFLCYVLVNDVRAPNINIGKNI